MFLQAKEPSGSTRSSYVPPGKGTFRKYSFLVRSSRQMFLQALDCQGRARPSTTSRLAQRQSQIPRCQANASTDIEQHEGHNTHPEPDPVRRDRRARHPLASRGQPATRFPHRQRGTRAIGGPGASDADVTPTSRPYGGDEGRRAALWRTYVADFAGDSAVLARWYGPAVWPACWSGSGDMWGWRRGMLRPAMLLLFCMGRASSFCFVRARCRVSTRWWGRVFCAWHHGW
jgi:hypothetical protein